MSERLIRYVVLAAGCLIAASAQAQGVRSGTPTPADSARAAASSGTQGRPTTLSGVYTDAQAMRGKDVYAGNCRSCHAPQSHTGETFAAHWRGKPLAELFVFVSTRMPQNDPGSLSPEDVADVVAYLLKMNAMPAGRTELYPAADSLKRIRIEMKRGSSDSTTMRKR